MNTDNETSTGGDIVFAIMLIGFVAFIIFVGYVIWDGLSDVQQQKGYCDALSGRYYSGDGPTGLCIKDNTVIKEWK